jgi:HK97 family phage major capsid protein
MKDGTISALRKLKDSNGMYLWQPSVQAGQPAGIFTANGGHVGVTVTSPTAITVDNVIDLIYSLKAPYRRNANFLMKDGTISALRKLKDSNGMYSRST